MFRYGVETYMLTKEFRKSQKEFFIFNKEKIIEKRKLTNLNKFGFENVFQNDEIKEKSRLTCLKNYGVEYPAQNEMIFLKTQSNRFKIRRYNDMIYYQGSYEKDFLEKYYDKIIVNKPKSFLYIMNNKNKYYHPDFYLPEFNLIIEIKSRYTYELEYEQNMLKKQTCILNGYNYIFIIDKNYIELEKILDYEK